MPSDGTEARIAALEAQAEALAGALRDIEDDHCRACNAWATADAALTADVQHLAQLDAARREVCAAARQFVDFVAVTAPGPHNLASIHDIRAAIDALAKLEGR